MEKLSGGGSGCTYAIKIKGDPEKASRLLGAVGITAVKMLHGKNG